MSKWHSVGSGKSIKTLMNEKIVLLAPDDMSNVVPLFCPCCEFPMKDIGDATSFRNVGVCRPCDNRWTNKPGVEWPQGPDKSTDEWKEYIEHRRKLSKPRIEFE